MGPLWREGVWRRGWPLGDYYYWYMPCYPDNMAVDLINRTTTDNLEFRDGAYYYKPKNAIEENVNESDRAKG